MNSCLFFIYVVFSYKHKQIKNFINIKKNIYIYIFEYRLVKKPFNYGVPFET